VGSGNAEFAGDAQQREEDNHWRASMRAIHHQPPCLANFRYLRGSPTHPAANQNGPATPKL
jgi:hypothetical protein